MSTDLVEWLRAQLDEDERTARAVTTEGAWRVGQSHGGPTVEGEGWTVASADDLDAAHIARHDPARVLREVDAKRQLLTIHRPYIAEPGQACLGCAGGIEFEGCPAVRLLALPYADRPGYLEEWRP